VAWHADEAAHDWTWTSSRELEGLLSSHSESVLLSRAARARVAGARIRAGRTEVWAVAAAGLVMLLDSVRLTAAVDLAQMDTLTRTLRFLCALGADFCEESVGLSHVSALAAKVDEVELQFAEYLTLELNGPALLESLQKVTS
jgi:hypothetical protein